MNSRQWKARDLASRCSVSYRQVHNILDGTSVPTTETVDEIARAFGLRGWHLLIPDLPAELVTSATLERLVQSFIDADDKGRDLTIRVLESQTR
jgi:hypothetical protein